MEGKIIQMVKMRSPLPFDEIVAVAKSRQAHMDTVPGLIQKFYMRVDGQPDVVASVYIWESRAHMQAFRDSEFAKTMRAAYKLEEAPVVEVMPVVMELK